MRGYHPKPLRRIYIPKKNGKKRPLGIPTMRDRAMQAVFLQALDPVAEVIADPNSYGFRRERACADAISQCFILLATKRSPQWILEGDIKACFDRIDHDWLISHAPMEKEILRKWLKAGYIEESTFHRTEDGTPQGGIISPVLANLALDGLEKLIKETFSRTQSQAKKSGVHMVRYADDFVITGRSKEILETQVKPVVERFLAERGLELSQEKTTITHIEDGFDFLGQNIRKYNGKYICKPSKGNVARFLAKIREFVKEQRSATAGTLVVRLNRKIRGWAMYHRRISAKRAFNYVDHHIFKALWRWCVRRHSSKAKGWIRKKYFTRVPGEAGGNNWVFFGDVEQKDGKRKPVTLFHASSVRIRYHRKIVADVNPYSPKWKEYLDRRHRRGQQSEQTEEWDPDAPGSILSASTFT